VLQLAVAAVVVVVVVRRGVSGGGLVGRGHCLQKQERRGVRPIQLLLQRVTLRLSPRRKYGPTALVAIRQARSSAKKLSLQQLVMVVVAAMAMVAPLVMAMVVVAAMVLLAMVLARWPPQRCQLPRRGSTYASARLASWQMPRLTDVDVCHSLPVTAIAVTSITTMLGRSLLRLLPPARTLAVAVRYVRMRNPPPKLQPLANASRLVIRIRRLRGPLVTVAHLSLLEAAVYSLLWLHW
jgi:hypothetical protein